jgi:hypothetical protein
MKRVAKAPRRHQKRALAAPFEQRVGRNRRSHFDDANCAGRNRLARSEAEETTDRLNRCVRIGGLSDRSFSGCSRPRGSRPITSVNVTPRSIQKSQAPASLSWEEPRFEFTFD